MPTCNTFGCECCTCLDCGNWKAACKCLYLDKAREFVKENKDTEDEKLKIAIDILEELI